MTRLKAKGFSTQLEEFGTGYSSLAYRLQFPFDSVNRDKSLVLGAEKPGDDQKEPLLRGVGALLHPMGKAMMANGIEGPGRVQLLREAGGNYGLEFPLPPRRGREAVGPVERPGKG